MHVIIHSVVNRTGASRYLREEIAPHATGVLLVWAASTGPNLEGWREIPLLSDGPPHLEGLAGLAWRLRALLAQGLYVIIHRSEFAAMDINGVSHLPAIVLSRFLNPSAVVRLHAHESPLGKWKMFYFVVRRFFRGEVFTVSPYMQAELRRAGIRAAWRYPRAFAAGAPMRASGGGQDAGPLTDAGSRFDIIVVAHPDASKGYRLILEVLARLPRRLTVVLYLSRAPPESPRFAENVTCIIGRSVAPDAYRARLCLQATDPSSVRETFSYIVADSLAAGVPVLCAPSGGVSEQLIHGVNGWFTSAYSADAFVAAIQMLFSSPTLLEGLAHAARQVQTHKRATL